MVTAWKAEGLHVVPCEYAAGDPYIVVKRAGAKATAQLIAEALNAYQEDHQASDRERYARLFDEMAKNPDQYTREAWITMARNLRRLLP